MSLNINESIGEILISISLSIYSISSQFIINYFQLYTLEKEKASWNIHFKTIIPRENIFDLSLFWV